MSAAHEWNEQELDRMIAPSLNIEPSDAFVPRVREAAAGATSDQEIAAALNVEPSPEFLARVRGAVAAQDAWRRPRVSGPALVTSGFALAAAVLLALWLRPVARPQPAGASTPVSVPSTSMAPATGTLVPPAPAVGSIAPLPPRQSNVRRRPSTEIDLPERSAETYEVLVSARDASAYYDYIASLDPAAVRLTPIAALEPATPMAPETTIAVERIVVEPIEPPSQ